MIVTEIDQHVKSYCTGEIFGEVSLMLGIPYSTSARTLEETVLFTIDKSNFEKLLRLSPKIAELIGEEFAKDQKIYTQVRQELEELGLLDMPEHQHALTWVRTRLKKLFHL